MIISSDDRSNDYSDGDNDGNDHVDQPFPLLTLCILAVLSNGMKIFGD